MSSDMRSVADPTSANLRWITNYGQKRAANTAVVGLADVAGALDRQQHFSAWNDVIAAILKV